MIKIEGIEDIKKIVNIEDISDYKCYIDVNGDYNTLFLEIINGLSFIIDNFMNDESISIETRREIISSTKDFVSEIFSLSLDILGDKDNKLQNAFKNKINNIYS